MLPDLRSLFGSANSCLLGPLRQFRLHTKCALPSNYSKVLVRQRDEYGRDDGATSTVLQRMTSLATKLKTTNSGPLRRHAKPYEGLHLVMTATGHSLDVYVTGDVAFDVDLPGISLSASFRAR